MSDCFEYHSYKIPDKELKYNDRFHIFYKNMHIEWTLEEFTINEKNRITNLILKSTKHIRLDNITKTIICKNKWGLNKTEKILMEHYHAKRNNLFPNNLIQLSLFNFVSDSVEWQDIIA